MRPTSIRLTPEQEAELAALVIALPLRHPYVAALARGGALTPGAVLRLAVARGLAELRRVVGPDNGAPITGEAIDAPDEPLLLDLAPPAPPNRDPFAPAGAPADDHAGPVVRPVVLPTPGALNAGDLARLCGAVPPSAPILVRQGEGWFDLGVGEVSDGRPVNEGDPDDPGCEVGWDVRPAGRRAPRGRWRRVLTFE
jgi:hypothetical protein